MAIFGTSSRLQLFRLLISITGKVALPFLWLLLLPIALGRPQLLAQDGGTITLRSDVQEANANTGVITARGNVQIDYPAQQIYATSAQAEYYSNERRIVLSGNVVINQEGNTLRAETATYLVDEGEFVALPAPNDQVEATYIIPAAEPGSVEPGATPTPNPDSAQPPVLLDVSPIETPASSPGSSAPLEN